MTKAPIHRIGTIGMMLALAALGGCASWWAPQSRQAASSPQAVATAKPMVSADLVRQVQTKLSEAGYYKNQSIDGTWGTGTRTAVQQFQKDHSLNASGELDAPTLQAMGIVSPATGGNAPPQPQNGTGTANPPPAAPVTGPTNPHG